MREDAATAALLQTSDFASTACSKARSAPELTSPSGTTSLDPLSNQSGSTTYF